MRKDFFVITHIVSISNIAKEISSSESQVQTIMSNTMMLVGLYEKKRKVFNADISTKDNPFGYEIIFSFKTFEAYKKHEDAVDALVEYIIKPLGNTLQATELTVMNYDEFLDKFILNFTLQNSLIEKTNTKKTKI